MPDSGPSPAHEEPSPAHDAHEGWTVQKAYDLWNDADDNPELLVDFVDVAGAILKTPIDKFDRIKLLVFLGTAMAAPRETAHLHALANAEWNIMNFYCDHTQEEEDELRERRAMIKRLGEVVDEETWVIDTDEEGDESEEGEEVGEQVEGVASKKDRCMFTEPSPPRRG